MTPEPSSPRTPGTHANEAVWMLVLPPVQRLLCHAEAPPRALLHAFVRHATCVDVVSRCDHEEWMRAAPPAAPGRLRCLWQPDPDTDYDLALLWEPVSGAQVSAWLAQLAALPLAPREVAVWSRNPLHGAGAPHWLGVDARLRRAGWRPGEAHLPLPEASRVRQIVEWRDYARTPLFRHRRTHRAWKSWIVHQGPYRWLQPARLRRAALNGTTPSPSVLHGLLHGAGDACGATLRLQRMLVSPNGVAIAAVRVQGLDGVHNAILKAPYTAAAEGRVARNATGLEWMAAQAGRLGGWKLAAPRLLGRGRAADWSWTLEECVAGTEAQAWDAAAQEHALHSLTGFLETLARLGEPSRVLDAESLEPLCGAAVRAASALLDAPLARRLHDLGERILQTLGEVRLPLVPRHGDFKLENVFGDAAQPERVRILDWELFAPRGLPLLDLWHLIASRRARAAGCSMGEAVRRWLLAGALSDVEKRLVQRLARGLDRRYVELSPLLYWLDRVGPIAARGAWPAPGWERGNVIEVLEQLPTLVAARR